MTAEEFFAKHMSRLSFDAETGCIEWTGARTKDGYGRYAIYENGVRIRQTTVHVYVWELEHPDHIRIIGDVIMHECNNPSCCNPFHLKLGTQKENAQHSVASGRHYQSNKTHCIHGHEYTPENTYLYNGVRDCKMCTSIYRKSIYAYVKKKDR